MAVVVVGISIVAMVLHDVIPKPVVGVHQR